METQKLLDILKNTLPPGQWDEFKKLGRIDEFESLRIVRKAILKRWREQSNDDFLKKGVQAFQKMKAWNVAKLSNILINQAYLHEYLDNEFKSNECIEKAVEHRSDESVIENAGRFFCHFTKRNINEQEKWNALLEREDKLLGEVSEGTRFIVKFQQKYGNNEAKIVSLILNSPLTELKNLEENLKRLLELSEGPETSFRIDLNYMDTIVKSSLKLVKPQFSENEKINKCDVLFLILARIMISARNHEDPDNFLNYADFVNSLFLGKKNGLNESRSVKKFYKKDEEYLERAIELGEKKIVNTEFTDQNAVTIYCLLASMYRIRGHVIRKKRDAEDDSLSDFYRAVELFRKIGDALYDERYFDRNVERFAECLSMSGEYQSAIAEYKKLFNESDDKKYQGALGLGRTHCDIGNFEESEYWYLEAKKIDGDSPGAYDGIVHVKKKQGKYSEAVKWTEKMLELPDITVESKNFMHFDIGELYLEEGTNDSLEKAIEVFKDIIENRQPDSQIAYDRLIKALMNAERYEEAIVWINKKIDQNDIDLVSAFEYCRLGECYSNLTNIKDEEEKECYIMAYSILPDYLPAYQRIVSWHERRDEYDEAIAAINEMIGIVNKEDSDGLWKWMGLMKHKKGDKHGAFEAFEKSLSINPFQPDLFRRIKHLPLFYQYKEELRKSIKALEIQYQNEPSEELAEYLINICLSIPDPENAKIAEKYLNKSGIQPNSSNYISKKAYILEIQERFKEAINLRKKLIPLGKISVVSEWNKLSNIKRIIQSINENYLYKKDASFRILEAKAFEFLVKILESKVDSEEGIIPTVESEEKIKEYINDYPEDIRLVAEKYHESGKYPLALKWIRKLTTHSELHSDKVYLFKEAEILLSLGRPDKALKVLDKILKYENHQDALAFFLKGRIKRDDEKEFPEAVKCLNEAYEINISESIKDVLKVLDQLGLTYRKWAKQPNLNADRRQELKNKALENYQKIIDDFPDRFDRRAYHGLAQSYLLGEPSEEEFGLAGYYYYEILRNGIKDKGSIQKKDLDQITVFELLYLWEKAGDVTLKKILIGESSLIRNLEERDENFIKWRIIQAAKRENIFGKDVFDTIKTVFQSSSNESLRQHCCQYFMKYLIYKSYNVSEQELQDSISNIMDMIISDSQEKKYIAENLSWFLAGERNAYLDLLTQKLKEDLDEISSLIFNLNKDDSSHKLEKLSRHLEAAKYKLKNIGLTKVEPKNISKEIHSRSEDLYKRRIGHRIELEANIFGLEGTIVSKRDWMTKEVMILYCFDLMKEIGLQGTCILNVNGENESKNDPVSIKLRAVLNGSHEEVSVFRRGIKQKFTPKTSFKINKGTQDPIGNPSWVFEIDLWLEKIIIPDKNPFEELSEFISKNFFYDENQVVRLNEKINNKISSIDSPEVFKNNMIKYLYHQIVRLTDQAKDDLAVKLDKPHELKNWSLWPPDELWPTIEEIQINFQSLKLMTKQFYLSGEDISFSLSDIIDQRIKAVRSPIIPITFQREENSNYQIVGDKESFKIMINNLCFNSVKSVKAKQRKEDKYEPEITVRLSTNNKEGEYELRFQDNGIGLDPSTTIDDQELGLGLRAVSYFLHNCDGEITIEEACKGDNSGVTFLITMPIRKEE